MRDGAHDDTDRTANGSAACIFPAVRNALEGRGPALNYLPDARARPGTRREALSAHAAPSRGGQLNHPHFGPRRTSHAGTPIVACAPPPPAEAPKRRLRAPDTPARALPSSPTGACARRLPTPPGPPQAAPVVALGVTAAPRASPPGGSVHAGSELTVQLPEVGGSETAFSVAHGIRFWIFDLYRPFFPFLVL